MSNRTEARSAKAARMHATGRLPLLRLFSTPLNDASQPLTEASLARLELFSAKRMICGRPGQ